MNRLTLTTGPRLAELVGATVAPTPTGDCVGRSAAPPLSACGNCEWGGPDSELKPIRDYAQRVEHGEPMPTGACPRCGALCHPIPDGQARARWVRLLDGSIPRPLDRDELTALTLETHLRQIEVRLGVDPLEALRIAWCGQSQ
jgi:hypothetical protein